MRPPRGLGRGLGRTLARLRYRRYMESETWRTVRRNWAALYGELNGRPPTCAICDQEWVLARDDLHHLSYDNLGDETFQDLMPFCRRCHERLHQWLDASPDWRNMPLRTASIELVQRLRG